MISTVLLLLNLLVTGNLKTDGKYRKNPKNLVIFLVLFNILLATEEIRGSGSGSVFNGTVLRIRIRIKTLGIRRHWLQDRTGIRIGTDDTSNVSMVATANGMDECSLWLCM